MLFSSLLVAALLPNAFAAPAPNADSTPSEKGVSVNKKRSNFWFAGVNESGAEFGSGNIPGTLGTDYTWPLTSSIDVMFDVSITKDDLLTVIDADGERIQHL